MGSWRHMAVACATIGTARVAIGCGENGGGTDGGGGNLMTEVTITVTIARCPVIDSVLVSPFEVTVGGSVALTATTSVPPPAGSAEGGDELGDLRDGEGGVDFDAAGVADGQAIELLWSAPSGRFADATSEHATFTCTAPGKVTLSLTATHDRCTATLSVPVDCLAANGGQSGD